MVEYLGGKCIVCGYDRCIKALDFHHRDPEKKGFTLGNSYNMSWERIRRELDKCVLICCRCHREEHAGLISLAGIAQSA